MKFHVRRGYKQYQKLIKLVWRWDYLVLSRQKPLEQGGGRQLSDSSAGSKLQTSFLVLDRDELFKERDMWAPGLRSSPLLLTQWPLAQVDREKDTGLWEIKALAFLTGSLDAPSEGAEWEVKEGTGGRKRKGVLAQCKSPRGPRKHFAAASLARWLKPSQSATAAFRDPNSWGRGAATGNEMSRNEVRRAALTDRTSLQGLPFQ